LLGERRHGEQLIFEGSKLLLKMDARQGTLLYEIVKKIVHHPYDSLKKIPLLAAK
jgi:hypothetical protein